MRDAAPPVANYLREEEDFFAVAKKASEDFGVVKAVAKKASEDSGGSFSVGKSPLFGGV